MTTLRITTAMLMLTASTGAALAQATTTAPTAKQSAPTASAPAPTARPSLPTGAGAVGRGSAASPAEAKRLHEVQMQGRQQQCSTKGAAYRWKPAHVVGDANPKGGFYTSNYSGGCGLISMKDALASGIVTVNPSAPRN